MKDGLEGVNITLRMESLGLQGFLVQRIIFGLLSTKKNPIYSPHHFLNEEQMTEIKSYFFSIQFNGGVKWRFKQVIGATARYFWNVFYRLVETRMGSP
ncbi:MAG: hypothetical protein NZ763_00855 [Candidatus Marinimicrobia bacterium]|nr:hypothetical protein [Candidatus Neomarinimicrobiota bacterium]